MSNKSAQPDIERLAAEVHALYQAEIKRQGRKERHDDDYNELPDDVKELDRVFVRWHLERVRRTETIHERIDRIQRECAKPGWNDANFLPSGGGIHPNTAKLTHRIADALPEVQFVGPSEEGEFEFEWNADDGTYLVDVLFLAHDLKESR